LNGRKFVANKISHPNFTNNPRYLQTCLEAAGSNVVFKQPNAQPITINHIEPLIMSPLL